MKEESEIEILSEEMAEFSKVLKSIQKAMARQELKETAQAKESAAPVINVTVPPIVVPEAQVTVIPADHMPMEPRPKKYLSVVTRGFDDLIISIETTVIG